MKPLKLLVLAAIGGIVITLLTGLLENTPEMLVGAVWYGYPLAWLVRMVVAPQYFPWVVRPLSLIADIVFWAVIVAIVLFAYTKTKKK
ncbi:MAG: hypothetical protein ABSC50_11390 [Candidatus Bathyarchaeia archaeon]